MSIDGKSIYSISKSVEETLRKLCKYIDEYISKNKCVKFRGIFETLMLFDKYTNLKCKFENRHFSLENYCVSTVGLNEAIIKKYTGAGETKYSIG